MWNYMTYNNKIYNFSVASEITVCGDCISIACSWSTDTSPRKVFATSSASKKAVRINNNKKMIVL